MQISSRNYLGNKFIREFVGIIAELRQMMLDNNLSFPEFAPGDSRKKWFASGFGWTKSMMVLNKPLNRIENLKEILSDSIEYTERIKYEIEQFKLPGWKFGSSWSSRVGLKTHKTSMMKTWV